jgi:hypothetical protein
MVFTENKQEIVELEKKYIQEQTLSPKEYGKGMRAKVPKRISSDSEEDGDDKMKDKIKKKKKTLNKESKRLEEIKTAKYIAKQLHFPASPTRFSPRKSGTPLKSNLGGCPSCLSKQHKIEQLEEVVKKLKKDKDAAIGK